jgi:hypothetical protein
MWSCRQNVGFLVGLGIAVLCQALPARADHVYAVDGKDSFLVGARELRSDVVYSGKETLSSVRGTDGTRYAVTVEYFRTDQGTRARARATFVSVVKPSGEQRDEVNGDPDYVAVLNQPFSIELDLPTMRDVARLSTPVPFSFLLPMAGTPLNGSLRSTGDAFVAGERTLGVVFDAEGPVHGPLGNVGVTLDGRIRMHGTAHYSYDSNMLRALDTQLTISGTLAGDKEHRAVTIVYRRKIRALAPPPIKDAAR